MFESFVIMLREGVEAALVVGILLVVLERSARRELKRAVYIGLQLAIAASLAAAIVLARAPISEELYEGVLYLTSAVFVGSMMFWVHRRSRTLKRDLEARAQRAVEGEGWREALGLGAFAFLMVFREGAEAVLFLSAVNLTTNSLLSALGAVAGLGLAVIFCVMFVRGSMPVDLRRFFLITEWMLGVFLVQLLVNGYHELAEIGLLPASAASMAIVGPVVRHNSLFILAIVAIPLGLWVTKKSAPQPAGTVAEGAESRLVRARSRRERVYRLGAITCALLIFTSVCVSYAGELAPRRIPPPEMVESTGDHVHIPLERLRDGKLHRFGYQQGNRTTRFLAMLTPDGKVRTALDACEICGSKGYLQEGRYLVCLNCGAEINPETIGIPGGCNPIPLDGKTSDGHLQVAVSDLVDSAHLFVEATGMEQIDPVCGMRVAMSSAAAFEAHEGKTIYFCSERCADRFHQDPAAFTN